MRPSVINNEMIEHYMIEYNRENKIFDDNHREIWQLTHLALSFKSKYSTAKYSNHIIIDIVEIDNLVGIETLVKL